MNLKDDSRVLPSCVAKLFSSMVAKLLVAVSVAVHIISFRALKCDTHIYYTYSYVFKCLFFIAM